jgi:hypothetical protein
MLMTPLSKSLILDGIAASEAIDSSGEVLSIKGLDISDVEKGTALLNYEHRGDQNEGASANDIIGHITFAKKVFGPDDCDNERQLKYWNSVQLPFVYVQAELFDGEGHPGAMAAAALVRYYRRRKMPIVARFSVEGSTLEREGNHLKRAVFKRLALTVKPCNRSCISGVLSDDKDSVSVDLKDLVRHENPNRKVLGSYEGELFPFDEQIDPLQKAREALDELKEINELQKALAAGGFDAMPTSLTGGSALQTEQMSGPAKKKAKFLKNQALAVLRDWRGHGDLRKFIKHRLPDTSPEFIEHFAKLVEDYQLRKTIELEDNLAKAVAGKQSAVARQPKNDLASAKPPKAPPVKSKGKAEALPSVQQNLKNMPLTVQGRRVPKPRVKVDKPFFDEKNGAVVTPEGIFQLSYPNRPHPNLIAQTGMSPEEINNHFLDELQNVRGSHQHAMKNFIKLNEALRSGNLHPGVLSHAVAFGLMSPGIKVPMQEWMYSHFVDAIHGQGHDALTNESQFPPTFDDWMARNRTMPQHSSDYFRDMFGTDKAKGSVVTSTGAFAGFNKPEKFREFYHSYLKNNHDPIMDVIRGSNGDGQQIARAMTKINGMAPKLARYMPLMFGAGNVIVPDTHMIRHMFGLRADPPGSRPGSSPDAATDAYLKNLLLNKSNPTAEERSHGILEAMDRHYFNNHPAVKAVLNDPDIGSYFRGNEQQAIGPAFWWHWSAIPGHEKRIGIPPMNATNNGTSHEPFFNAVMPLINKSEMDDELPLRTAALHHAWIAKYGPNEAMHLYYKHIVPQLLRWEPATPIQKMERLAAKLRKMAGEEPKAPATPLTLPELPEPSTQGLMGFRGKHIQPGEVEVVGGPFKGSKMHYVGHDHSYAYVRPKDKPHVLHSLPFSEQGKTWHVVSDPTEVHLPSWVDARYHGDKNLNRAPEQFALMHGIDINNRKARPDSNTLTSEYAPETGWYTNHAGVSGFVKPNVNNEIEWQDPDDDYVQAQYSYSLPHREVLFHNMARDFFGLGAHVPTTSLFYHPKSHTPVSVQERVKNAEHIQYDDDDQAGTIGRLGETGDLDKMVLMDHLMGNNDRHTGNFMFSPHAPNLHLIDNGLALDYSKVPFNPDLWEAHDEMAGSLNSGLPFSHQPIHANATQWLTKLDPSQYVAQLASHGVPPQIIKRGFNRLRALQLAAMEAATKNQPLTRGGVYSALKQVTPGYTRLFRDS